MTDQELHFVVLAEICHLRGESDGTQKQQGSVSPLNHATGSTSDVRREEAFGGAGQESLRVTARRAMQYSMCVCLSTTGGHEKHRTRRPWRRVIMQLRARLLAKSTVGCIYFSSVGISLDLPDFVLAPLPRVFSRAFLRNTLMPLAKRVLIYAACADVVSAKAGQTDEIVVEKYPTRRRELHHAPIDICDIWLEGRGGARPPRRTAPSARADVSPLLSLDKVNSTTHRPRHVQKNKMSFRFRARSVPCPLVWVRRIRLQEISSYWF